MVNTQQGMVREIFTHLRSCTSLWTWRSLESWITLEKNNIWRLTLSKQKQIYFVIKINVKCSTTNPLKQPYKIWNLQQNLTRLLMV